jgi:hypothetical protein
MFDLANNISPVSAFSPAVLAATTTGSALDMQGFGSGVMLITTGAIVGSGDFSAKLQESDTTTSGDFTDIAAGNIYASNLVATLLADSTYKVGFRKLKRYVRVVLTRASGTSLAAGAILVRGDAMLAPTA